MTKLLANTIMTVACVCMAWPASVGMASNPDKLSPSTNNWNYWQKYKEWEALTAGNGGTPEDEAKAEQILDQLIKGVYLVKFAPVEEFNPHYPGEILREFGKTSSLRSAKDRLGGASFFRTKRENNKLTASFLTEYPEQMKQDIEKNPQMVFISMEEVTLDNFIAHVKSPQESLQNAPARNTYSRTGNTGKYMACDNHGGAGFFWVDTTMGKIWWSDMTATATTVWKYYGHMDEAKPGALGTYIPQSNKNGTGLFILNTVTGEGWWTDGKEWKALGKPE